MTDTVSRRAAFKFLGAAAAVIGVVPFAETSAASEQFGVGQTLYAPGHVDRRTNIDAVVKRLDRVFKRQASARGLTRAQHWSVEYGPGEWVWLKVVSVMP